MCKSRIVLFSLLASAVLFSAACKKDNAGGDGTRLSKIVISDTYDSTGSVIFKYDGNGRIENITNTFRNTPRSRVDFNFDASGKLKNTVSTSLTTNFVTTESYYYEGDKLVKKIYDNLQQGGDYYFNYTYDAQKKLIADTAYGFSVPMAMYNHFEYTGNNLTQWETFYGSHSAGWQPGGTTKATYTTADNPFYEHGQLFFITMGDFARGITAMSEKLVSSIEYPNGEKIEYDYEYYSSGLVKRANIKSKKTTYRQTIDFYYE